jgi:hypothetical protein
LLLSAPPSPHLSYKFSHLFSGPWFYHGNPC